jgi:hypothetical protein
MVLRKPNIIGFMAETGIMEQLLVKVSQQLKKVRSRV